jgi:predicted negative regulator of RcsB-dependent stress response
MYNEKKESLVITFGFIIAALMIIGIIVALMFGWQWFKVYSREQTGKAQLAEATFSKQIKFEEAKANLESQKLNAQAEVERAKGAAQAIEIESGKLSENYIRYLWVQQQDNLNDKTVIYIPTEAGLPMLESNRLPTNK